MSSLGFSEVVGLDVAKEALLLAAVEPRLGGVLLRGDKGSAKTTLARGLAAVLPGDAPFVELPLGAGEDRVLGALDLADLLGQGRPRLRPGLLADAHGGVLYIDEINLLADHLVDALLDVAVSGVNRVEREGLSEEHPARFVLVASMNPEEGELRPQLLDRFGLTTEVRAPSDVALRAEAVRRQLGRESCSSGDGGPGSIPASESDAALRTRVGAARALTPVVPGDVIELACAVSLGSGAEGLRADLSLVRAAGARARLDGRCTVTATDVEAVASLVLAHRRRRGPADAPGIDQAELDELFDELRPNPAPPAASPPAPSSESGGSRPAPSGPTVGDEPASDGGAGCPTDGDPGGRDGDERGDGGGGQPQAESSPPAPLAGDTRTLDTALSLHQPTRRSHPRVSQNVAAGRSDRAAGTSGRVLRSVEARQRPGLRPDGAASAVALATRRGVEERADAAPQPTDLRVVDREMAGRALVVFAVDTSTSMGRDDRLAVAKGAVQHLLGDAYRRRSRVALIAFHHDRADVVLRPTSSIEVAMARLGDMPSGGTTPVGAGLDACGALVKSAARSGDRTVVVVLTDGRATAGGVDPLAAATESAGRLAAAVDDLVIVDTESGYPRLGLAATLADAVGARLVALSDLEGSDPGRELAGGLGGFGR